MHTAMYLLFLSKQILEVFRHQYTRGFFFLFVFHCSSVPFYGCTIICLTLRVDILVASIILLLKPCCIEIPCNFAPVRVYLYGPCFIDGTAETQGDAMTSPRSQMITEASSTAQPLWEFPTTTTWNLGFSSAAVVSCCHGQVLPSC